MMDGFRGIGYGPYRLSTLDFYNLCKQHLNKDGVVLVNVLRGDQLYFEKVLTFKKAFTQTYLFHNKNQHVLIGTNSATIDPDEIVQRARKLQEDCRFEFSIVDESFHIKNLGELVSKLPEINKATILTDENPPSGYFDSLSSNSSIFTKAKKNELCPCGSGKAFKNCHGRFHKVGH